MTVNIGFRPHSPKKLTYIDGGSSLLKVIEAAFHEAPVVLDSSDIQKLEGIYACGYEAVGELIAGINKFGKIVLDAEY